MLRTLSFPLPIHNWKRTRHEHHREHVLARLAARSTALVAVSVLTAVTACAQTDVDDGGHKARGMAATLQADAKALLPQGAPGVPVDVRTAHRTV